MMEKDKFKMANLLLGFALYDRKKDGNEMKNVYHEPTYAKVVADLKEKLAVMRVKYKDSPELDQKYLDLYKEKMKGSQWWK